VAVSTPRFVRIALRTTAVAAAREFYGSVIGGQGDGIVELPEAAIARGARPHWLGHIGVAEIGGVDELARRFEARGATRLGPPRSGDSAVVRDPGGAVVALTDASAPSRAGVVWHHLNTADAPRAAANYAALFGWALTARVDVGALAIQRFAWSAGEPDIGSIADLAGRPEVHPHWLFYFGVHALDDALAHVRGGGGLVAESLVLPNGVRLATCDDPQGAAFGLMERS
jgi:predicted enzyme related to lactoylglutathione lyase